MVDLLQAVFLLLVLLILLFRLPAMLSFGDLVSRLTPLAFRSLRDVRVVSGRFSSRGLRPLKRFPKPKSGLRAFRFRGDFSVLGRFCLL